MRKIFTLILSVMFVFAAFAQKPEGVIKKASVAPVLDGVIDDVWEDANVYNIDKNFQLELPTLGEVGETTWKALYTEDGYYLLLTVTDDSYFPNYVNGSGNDYEYDKVEFYFDVNYLLEDGLGGGQEAQGHYQVAPAFTALNTTGELQTTDRGEQFAILVTDPNYVCEFFVPFSILVNGESGPIDLTGQVGFDVTIIDRDPGDAARKRAVWANIGEKEESWANMDDAGIITFEGADAPVFVEEINLTGGVITTDNGTLQIVTEVLPEDATIKTVKYTIVAAEGSTARATISSTGLVTGVMDGKMIVSATSLDGFVISNDVEVDISGQVIQEADVNVIKNGNFDEVNANGSATDWGGWVDGAYGDPTNSGGQVADGVVALNSILAHATEGWHYQFNQTNLNALPNIPYHLSFVAWAAVERPINFDFESASAITEANGGDQYVRYGTSSDTESNGSSDWNITLTTEPTRYNFTVTFDKMIPTTIQKFQFMISQAVGTVYIDSVTLISEADKALLPTAIAQNSMQSFKVYPNPAVDKLYINLTTPNAVVAIYNSVGVKMDEVNVVGTQHTFDVSRYTKGLYFVKANNAVVKFVK